MTAERASQRLAKSSSKSIDETARPGDEFAVVVYTKPEKKSKKDKKKKDKRRTNAIPSKNSSDSEVELSRTPTTSKRDSNTRSARTHGSGAQEFDDNASVYSEQSYVTTGGTRKTRRVPSRTRGRYRVSRCARLRHFNPLMNLTTPTNAPAMTMTGFMCAT